MPFIAYSATLPPPPYQIRDIVFASTESGIPQPSFVSVADNFLVFGYDADPALTQQEVDDWNVLVASNPTPANAPWRLYETTLATVRQWIDDNNVHLARVSPTSAQNTAQIKALTRQLNFLLTPVADG